MRRVKYQILDRGLFTVIPRAVKDKIGRQAEFKVYLTLRTIDMLDDMIEELVYAHVMVDAACLEAK